MALFRNAIRIGLIWTLVACIPPVSPVWALTVPPVKDIAVDSKGRIYAATWGGITIYDQGGTVLDTYTKTDGLPTDTLTSVCTTPDDRVWFGSTHGVICLSDGQISIFTMHDGLNDSLTYAVAYSPSLGLLIGTERGVCRFTGDCFQPLDDEHEFARSRVYDIHIDQKGTAWFAKEAGLSRYASDQDRTVFKREILQFPAESAPIRNEIFCVTTDRHQRPWVGTRTGISHFDGHKWRSFMGHCKGPVGFTKILNPYVTTLCFGADRHLWIGHGNGANEGVTVMKDGVWRHANPFDGCPTGSVYKLRRYGDKIWIATSNGIFCYSKGRFERFGRLETHTLSHQGSKRNIAP